MFNIYIDLDRCVYIINIKTEFKLEIISTFQIYK